MVQEMVPQNMSVGLSGLGSQTGKVLAFVHLQKFGLLACALEAAAASSPAAMMLLG
jgi:hypothetical protein